MTETNSVVYVTTDEAKSILTVLPDFIPTQGAYYKGLHGDEIGYAHAKTVVVMRP